jgi:streptogramin lyase
MDVQEVRGVTPLMAFLFLYTIEPQGPTTLVYPPFGHCMGIYRAGTEQLSMLLGGLVRFDDPQGLACVKLTEWDGPGRDDDDELAVYGVNSGSGHIIYNATMYTLGLYGGTGSGPTELRSPHGIAADPSGRIVVADTGNSRIAVLGRQGPRIVPVGFITEGLSEPWGVALGSDGAIWVTDRAAGLLLRYEDPDDTVPDEVPLDFPRGVAVYGGGTYDFYDEDSFQAVIVRDGAAMVRLEEGEVTAEVTPGEYGGSFFNYAAIDYYGNVWVTDSVSCMIHKFDRDLAYITSFGSPGTGDFQFDCPTGIALWRRYGQVFVGESEGARYFWLGTDFVAPEFAGQERGMSFRSALTEQSNVLIQILDSSGSVAASLPGGRNLDRLVDLTWEGVADDGYPVPDGDYLMRVTIEPTYSSRGYFAKVLEQSFSIPAGEGQVQD